MGGIVPLGYRVEARKLVVDEGEAETVRLIFTRYWELGSMPRLTNELAKRGVRTRIRKLSSGRIVGGIPLTTGPLQQILSNRVYLGEINDRGQSYPGEHEAILTTELFHAVQERLRANRSGRARGFERSDSFLMRLIYDDRGNRMSPVFANKAPRRYRYYQSWVIAQGRKHEAGSVPRVPAEGTEQAVVAALRTHLAETEHPDATIADSKGLVRTHIAKVVVKPEQLELTLNGPGSERSRRDEDSGYIEPVPKLIVPWSRPSARCRREILRTEDTRPIRSEARARLVAGIARGRRWLDQIMDGAIRMSLESPHVRTCPKRRSGRLCHSRFWRRISFGLPLRGGRHEVSVSPN